MVTQNKFFSFPAMLTPPPPWLPFYLYMSSFCGPQSVCDVAGENTEAIYYNREVGHYQAVNHRPVVLN